MAVELLLDKAREYIPKERLGVISDAYAFAESAHNGQVRLSGEAFIEQIGRASCRERV